MGRLESVTEVMVNVVIKQCSIFHTILNFKQKKKSMQGKGLQLKGTEDHTSLLSILEVVAVNITDNCYVSLMGY